MTGTGRSEEHTSELQSLRHLVCRLLLEKKNKEVFSVKTRFFILFDDLDVGQPLTICADLVLSFDYQYAFVLKRAMSFSSGLEIKVSDRSVPLGAGRRFVPIAVVSAKRRVCAAAGFMSGFAPFFFL